MNRKTFLLLIFCNLIWAANPIMGKILVAQFNGVQVGWIRYISAFFSFLIAAFVAVAFFGRKWTDFFLIPRQLGASLQVVLIGLGPFVFSPIMQFVGLETAQAMDNAVLIATEPLLTVWMAWLVLGEKMHRDHWVSVAIALVGFLFFGGFLSQSVGTSVSVGMIFLVFAQLGEGMYSVLTRRLVQTHSPLAVLGSGLTIGATALTLFVFSFDHFPDFSRIGVKHFEAIVWLGPLGSTATYLIWAMIAKTVTVPTMAISLFIQPLVGAMLGYAILDERLTVERAFGASLILSAITYLSLREMWKERQRAANLAPSQKKTLR